MRRCYNGSLALIAGALLFGTSGVACASSLNLTGSALSPSGAIFYGRYESQNNVVNSPGSPFTGSVLTDPTGPSIGSDTPWIMNGSVATTSTNYSVDWFYAGSESGYAITFDAPGLIGSSYTEHDYNNNCAPGCPSGGARPSVFIGSTDNSLDFILSWSSSGSISNTGATSGSSTAHLIYSYLAPNSDASAFTLTKDATDWFAFALDDPGSTDRDYDDFVGYAHLVNRGDAPSLTPLPASLPLFASGVFAVFLLFRPRKRRYAKLTRHTGFH